MCFWVLHVEVGAFEVVVDRVFVFFRNVKNEWAKAGVAVLVVLFPHGCASDGDYYACAGFAHFDG